MASLILGLVLTIGWLACSWILIMKTKTASGKIGKYVLAVFLFILCTGIFVGIQIGLPIVKNIIGENVTKVDDYMIKNYGNIPLVRSGVDVSAAPQAISELETLIPHIITTELGLSNFMTKSLVKSATDVVFGNLKSKTDYIAGFANEDGRINSTSVIKALEAEVITRIERIVFWIYIVLAAVLAVFLIIRILEFLKNRKNQQPRPEGTGYVVP
ncbi:MAG: hypothetical protein LBU66_07935 [Treponema sp.]|nr:hypothetical protein [Treponema sp.]